MRSEILRDAEALAGLAGEWATLFRESADPPLTLHPAWVESWWRALGGDGELMLVTVRGDGGELRGVAPLYLRPPRGGALRVRELSLAGDGVVSARAAILARATDENAVRDAVVDALVAERAWDLFDVSLADPARAGQLAQRFAERGRRVAEDELLGRRALALPLRSDGTAVSNSRFSVAQCEAARLRPMLAALVELSAGGAERRTGEAGFVRFLERVLPALVEERMAMLWLVEDPAPSSPSGAVAAAHLLAASLVVSDGDRRVELVRGVAPGWAAAGEALTAHAIARAAADGATRFEPVDDAAPASAERDRGVRLRVFSGSTAAVLTAGYSSLERRAGAVADAARGEIDRLRDATKDIVERAASRVAQLAKLHLYRGELFLRNAPLPPGITLSLFTLGDFEALADRAAFLQRLDLDETYCRQKWERGDLVVLARLDGEPAGILWCARYAVYVPEIGREVKPLGGECYIHDVYVAPSARGRAVAPVMLEFLARELRARDVYRAWALIERSNTSSTRAFEKASYASVADVVYARMGLASKLLVRPPDPEARKFLGLK